VTTIKPVNGLVEYGVQDEAGEWVIHGLTVPVDLEPESTLGDVQGVAEADARARGLI
jgi:hypothetical protein